MNSEEKYSLIEKYLSKKLEGAELENFEAQLQRDPELKAELDLHRQLSETLKGEKVHELRNVLNEVNENWETPATTVDTAKVVNFNFRRVLSIAAAVALLFIGFNWFFNNNFSSQEIYASNFEPYVMVFDQRSANPSEVSPLDEAIALYHNKDFGTSADAFEKLLAEDQENMIYIFYVANARLANQETDKAIGLFKKIIKANDLNFVEQSRWYLALAYLQKDDTENAKSWLEKIQEEQFKYKEAKDILRNF